MVTVVRGLAEQRAKELQAELTRLEARLPTLPGVEAAYVFGSLVEGGVHASSDLDLLIVRRTTEPFFERALTLFKELEPQVPVDLFVYTPEEIERAGRFITYAMTRGRRLL